MERADDPVEEGTPLNKILFDSIKNSIQEVEDKGLPLKKYNELIHHFETNTYVKTYSHSCIGTDCSATYTTDGSETLGGMLDWNDSSTGTTNLFAGDSILVTLSKPIVIKKITFDCAANSTNIGTGYFKLEVSEDGSTYTSIYTGSRGSTSYATFTVDLSANETAYKYLKLTRTDSNKYQLNFRKFAITEAVKTDNVKNICTSSITFEGLTKQRFMTIIPTEYDSTLPIVIKFNNMEIPINENIIGGARYELIYDNETFLPIEIVEHFITGTYTGNSTSNRIVKLGFTPKALIIQSTNATYLWYGAYAILNSGKNVSIVEDGFKVSYNSSDSANDPNRSNTVYFYIAFR